MSKSPRVNCGQINVVADRARRWNLLLWPMALVFMWSTLLPLADCAGRILRRPVQPRGWDDYLIVAVIALVDIALLGAAGYVTLRSRKFGRSHLELATLPVIGGELVGTIVTSRPIADASHVQVALICEDAGLPAAGGAICRRCGNVSMRSI